MALTAEQVLVAGLELISDPKRWTKGAWARDKRGFGVGSCTEEAVCWCSDGAVNKVINGKNLPLELEVERALGQAAQRRGFNSFVGFNDHCTKTHEDVIAMWRDAIEIIRSKS
jgi:hypothetical protein